MLHDPLLIVVLFIKVNNNLCYNFGRVFREIFVSFLTFEVYTFTDSNLLCWKEELLRQLVM